MKRKINKNRVAFGLHSPDLKILYYAQIYNPESLFFYVKTNERIKFPDNEHAIKINEINKIIYNLKSLKLAIGNGNKKK